LWIEGMLCETGVWLRSPPELRGSSLHGEAVVRRQADLHGQSADLRLRSESPHLRLRSESSNLRC
jgi:hypothetical protein